METKKIKIVIYARTACAAQDEVIPKSIESQLQTCRDFAKQHGYLIINEIWEVGSGIDPNRKGIKKLLKRCDKGDINNVLTTTPDRLSRRSEDYYYFKKHLANKGANLVSCNCLFNSKFEEAIWVAFEQFQSEQHSLKIKRALNQKKELQYGKRN